jgi:hypothetical protein
MTGDVVQFPAAATGDAPPTPEEIAQMQQQVQIDFQPLDIDPPALCDKVRSKGRTLDLAIQIAAAIVTKPKPELIEHVRAMDETTTDDLGRLLGDASAEFSELAKLVDCAIARRQIALAQCALDEMGAEPKPAA